MRIRIIFSLENRGAALPFFHQHLFTELVETLIPEHLQGIRGYHFSGLKGQTRISRKGLHFCSKYVTLVFASHHTPTIKALVHAFFERKYWQVGALRLHPVRVEREQLPEFKEAMKYICISPIVPMSKEYPNAQRKSFMEPDQDIFSDFMYETLMARMDKSGLYTAEEIASFYRFQVVPDKHYLKKIRQNEKKFARIYSIELEGRAYEIRGYTFPLTLYADPEVQKFAFISGIGALTEQGFGMLDLANRNPKEQTKVIYTKEERIVQTSTSSVS